MARKRNRSFYLLLITALLIGAFSSVIRLQGMKSSPLLRAHTISFTATVKTDPVLGKAKTIGVRFKSPPTSFLATLGQSTLDGRTYSLRLPVRITTAKSVHFLPGDQITGQGTVFVTAESRVAALIASKGDLVIASGTDPINRLAGVIRNSFRASAQTIGGSSGNLIPGLVVGDTSLEESSFITSMRRSGLTHLTAVSGENFAIIAAFLLWLLQFVFRRLGLRLIVTAVVLLLFIFLVRPSPSVLRATVMTGVLLLGKARGERGSALPALGLAISLLILIDPFQAVDPGFALSVSATAGILILSEPLTDFFSRYIRYRKAVELLVIPLAATIFCTPLTIAISGQLSLVSLPANLLVAEFVAPITIIGFIAALISPIFGQLSHLLLLMCKPFAAWIVLVAKVGGAAPLLTLPKSYIGAAMGLALITLLARKAFKIAAILTILVVALHLLTTSGWPGNWVMVNCDVGQGDGAVINLGDHSGIVIDVGPDPAAMDNCLKSLAITEIPLLVLTHFHADHVIGLPAVLTGRKVGQVWVTSYPMPAMDYQITMSALQGHSISRVYQGESIAFGDVSIKVLWPQREIVQYTNLEGDGSTVNNSSIALLVTVGKIRIFTSGDTEPPAQQAIAESGMVGKIGNIGQVDIMKVSHHGSAYQYDPLFDLLKPKVALVSVGAGNPYGHPSPRTLAALSARGIPTYRTDLLGAISVDTSLRITTQANKSKWWNISWG